jgi:hypothetical protein
MKNIHVVPTDKPSRLWINNLLQGKLELSKEFLIGSNTAQHIYITSDEEIKEENWVINLNSPYAHKELCRIDNQLELERYAKKTSNNCKKIILTTDQDLIKEGVQAIDNEFLEWFVKNPSCEEVETFVDTMGCSLENCNGNHCVNYKIIIPKEEPNFNMKNEIEWVSNNSKCKQIESCYNSLSKKCICPQEEAKQETLEEAAVRCFEEMKVLNPKGGLKEFIRMAVNFGVKWQQEQDKKMYSEEEVEKIARAAYTFGEKEFKYFGAFKEWFEQFKKK